MERGTKAQTRPRALGSLLALLLVGCGSSPVSQPKGPDAPRGLDGDRFVSTVSEKSGARFRFVERHGEPEVAATAVFLVGTSRNAALAEAALQVAFGAKEGSLSLERRAGFLVYRSSGRAASKELNLLFEVLRGPKPGFEAVRASFEKLRSAPKVEGTITRDCIGLDGGEAPSNPEALSLKELNELWNVLTSPSALALGLVGTREQLDEFRKLTNLKLPGDAPRWVRSAAPNSFGADLSEVDLVARSASLGTLLSMREVLVDRFPEEASHLSVVPNPNGSCLFVTTAAEETRSFHERLVMTETWKRRFRAAEKDLTLDGAVAHALLEPDTAREVADLAALSLLGEAEGDSKNVEYFSRPAQERPEVYREKLAELERLSDPGRIPGQRLDEQGHARLRLLLGTPCGTAAEPANWSGARALVVESLAERFDGTEGVTLLPWVSVDGVGLVAEAAHRPRESDRELAARVARVVAMAWREPISAGPSMERARSRILARLGANLLLGRGLRLLGPEHPSAVSPWGLPDTIEHLHRAELHQSRAAMLAEPLRFVLADNGESLRGTFPNLSEVQAILGEELGPLRETETPCANLPNDEKLAGGVWTVSTVEETARSSRAVLIGLRVRREVGQGLAALLTRPGGVLDRSLAQSGLATTSSVSFVGSEMAGGLWIQIGAEEEQFEAAERQARAALDHFARGTTTEEEVAFVFRKQEAALEAARATAVGRLVEAFVARAPAAPTREELDAARRELAGDRHLLLHLRRRK